MPMVYHPTDIFTSPTEAIVNPVNCVGIMGRGLALSFKHRYPTHFASYQRACRNGSLRPGTLHVDELAADTSPRFLIALPTKRHWRNPSRLQDIQRSIQALTTELHARRISSVSIPKLGCGLGGLTWRDVHAAILPLLTASCG